MIAEYDKTSTQSRIDMHFAWEKRFAKVGSMVEAKFTVPQSICLERFEDFPQLGRFTLRDEGKSIAIGKVMSLGEA